MSVNVALIGGGIWAREEHLPAILASNEMVLKAVYSRSRKSAQSIADAVAHDLYIHTDEDNDGFDKLLERSDVHAVIISLPIKNQAAYIRQALKAGKHVLSEKPVCENVKDAVDLIGWYRTEVNGPSWCVAENWRFLESYRYATKQLESLGRIRAFHGRQHSLVQPDGKFYQTPWRKEPTHQGGFLLDGGVHYMAGIRQLLSVRPGDQVSQVTAFTTLLQDYLPPVDTAYALFKTVSGAVGTFQLSVGSTAVADEWRVECDHGWISINGHGGGSEVTVSRHGEVLQKTIPNERTGVPAEIRGWGQALVQGKVLKEQEPENALADLELLELMLKSGESEGITLTSTYQGV